MVYRAATSDKVSEREQKNEVRARTVASQCTVLLENDYTLPLKQSWHYLEMEQERRSRAEPVPVM